MSDIAPLEPAVASATEQGAAERPRAEEAQLISVRTSPGGYFAAASALSIIALLFLRTGHEEAVVLFLVLAWVCMPLLALTDRVRIQARVVYRTGFIAFLQKLFHSRVLKLDVDDIERVETYAVRTLRRGGSVRYRYRSEVAGRGMSFVFASGSGYRQMVRHLFALVDDEKLDARSRELRDYLVDAKHLRSTVGLLHIAPSSVLDAVATLRHKEQKRVERALESVELSASELERGQLLRLAANELRAAGRLREAAEAFRRALLVTPHDGWLLYEFARFLRSQASALSDARLLSRSRAGLRLAARRAREDAQLLARIGESFFEFGEMQRAGDVFRRALDLQPRAFRAETGLAEIALRNGKLAHVIHHYQAATRIAPDEALARLARREADYYSLLNDDDDYLAAELRRINWLQTSQTARRISARLTLASILLALVGAALDDTLSAVGWSLAASSLAAWIGVSFAGRYLSQRRRPRPVE